MNNNRRVKILIKIVNNQVGIIHGGSDNVYYRNTMNLLAILVDVKVESDIVLSEVFKFHESGDNVQIELVEDDYFPDVFFFVKYLLIEVLLFFDEIDFGLWLILHPFDRDFQIRK